MRAGRESLESSYSLVQNIFQEISFSMGNPSVSR